MKTKAKFEFYRATQKVKPGKWCQLYDGVIIEKSKETVSMVCVDKGEDDVNIVDLDPSEYNFKVIEKEIAENTFSIAILNLTKDLSEAQKNLLIAQRNLDYAQKKYAEFFK